MSNLHVPHLSEVRRVMAAQLYEYRFADDLMDAMERCGIGCFTDTEGTYWFGSDAPEIPEHDRWLCLLTRRERMEHGYNSGRFQVLVGCGELVRAVRSPLVDLIEYVQDLARQQAHTLAILGYDSEAERQVLAWKYLIAVREFGLRGPNQMAPFVRVPWGEDLHALVHHWDAWSAVHNSEGIPQDLVLRLHGLAAHADELKYRTQSW